jgi:hypothetical protein
MLAPGQTDAATLRQIALLLLVLAVLSPRVTHYDLLILLPAVAVLLPVPSQRIALVAGCVVVPWACRLGLTAARFEPLKSWLSSKHDLDYSTLWNFYMFATWLALAAYAWWTLSRESVDALVTGDLSHGRRGQLPQSPNPSYE